MKASLRFFCVTVFVTTSASQVACGGEDTRYTGPRVVVLGFDGMDWALVSRLMEDSRLPALSRLAESGHAQALGTAVPPQSPVAWSDFITGLDAGGHGIFDFIHRDPETMVPYLSTSATVGSPRLLKLGDWQIPLGGETVALLRRGSPFWRPLASAEVPTTIVRIPANYPPTGMAARELSGMGTPDLLGGYGTYTLFTTRPDRMPGDLTGGRVVPVRFEEGAFHGFLSGPPNPFRVDGDSTRVEVAFYRDRDRPVAKLAVDGTEYILNEGEWTDWVSLEFRALPLVGAIRAMVRLHLREVHPDFEVYASPLNIDPLDPAAAVSSPPEFSRTLAMETGRYYTQGMPEDTKALTSSALDEVGFLQQAGQAAEEQIRQYDWLLDDTDGGLLFYYFGFLDQVSHVMWHPMDPDHPAYDPVRDAVFADVIPGLYERADSIVGATLERLEPRDLLIVMSDHGFTAWRRAFHLNAWLLQNGYLTLRGGATESDAPFLAEVDWARTQAYALGFTGLYINLEGREAFGSVPRNEYRLVRDEIARRLSRLEDPATGEPAVWEVFRRDETYSDGGFREIGPDLVIGYAKGTRASDATGEGLVPVRVWEDNISKWSGDHLMHPDAVPGVLFTNRPLTRPVSGLRDLSGAIVSEFGLDGFPGTTLDTNSGED